MASESPVTICSGVQVVGGCQPNGYDGARCVASSAFRITSMTTPSNWSPTRPSSSKMMLSVSERRQSPRNCHAKPSKRRTSSHVGYWRSLLGCGDESDIQQEILPWNAFSIQSKGAIRISTRDAVNRAEGDLCFAKAVKPVTELLVDLLDDELRLPLV